MAKVLVEETSLQNIANSIREKTGTEDTYKPSEMASAISSIETGGGSVPEKGIVINEWNSDGYPTDISIVGFDKIPSSYFYNTITGNNIFKAIVNLQISDDCSYIKDDAFNGCSNLQSIKLPSGLIGFSSYVFNKCSKLSSIELPNGITAIGNYCFYNCQKLVLTEIPVGVTRLGERVFYECDGLTELNFLGDVLSLGRETFYSCSNLEKIFLPNVTTVPTLESSTFSSTPIASGTGFIYVPDTLVDSFKSATNWSTYADQIKPISYLNIQTIEIASPQIINTYNDNKTANIEVTYNGGESSLLYPEQEGYTLSVSGNATIEGNVLTLTNNAQVGDIITVTVTSTYDTSISSTQEIEVVYEEPSISVNLNDGQWIDSGTTADNGNIIYKSDAGSYHTNNGKSTAVLTVNGYTSVKLYIRSYAESTYDYTEAFAIDTTATREKGLFTTKGKQSATSYVECIYNLDGGTHTIEIMYSKDSSGDNNDDRGYFYIGECS